MDLPATMTAMVLVGHGGPEQLVLRDDVPLPHPRAGEVLIEVGASAVNNTDINTRVGWYSRSESDTGWSGAGLNFPLIQGADCCGRIVLVGAAVDPSRIGERVLVRTMQDPRVVDGVQVPTTLGSEIDGAFAEYVVVRSSEAFAIASDLSDVELATFPCSYSTAEGLLHRADVVEGERVLVTGASGGVGSAVVQLAKARGAEVVAVTSKPEELQPLGADEVSDRDLTGLDEGSVDVVIDLVGGDGFGRLLQILRPGGRYAVSGAVGGAHVDLDLRDLYLKDLTLLGCTFHPREIFASLIERIESGQVRPLVAATYPLAGLVQAQEHFARKDFVGKIAIAVRST